MSALHHLTNENKKKLYKKCYDALEDEGWFFNIDEMKTISEDAHLKNLYSGFIMLKNKETLFQRI